MSNNEVLSQLAGIGALVEDAIEETFLLFSQNSFSNDLGILNPKDSHVDVEIAGIDYRILQSSTLLRSTREMGTTGAMLWKVTPLVADWLSTKSSVLWRTGILSSSSNVVELGCGIAGLIGMALSPHVGSYLLTDQEYVMKLLKENIVTNTKSVKRVKGSKKQQGPNAASSEQRKLDVLAFDWELDSVQTLHQALPGQGDVDIVVLCDCVYNTYLICPLVEVCVDICRLNTATPTVLLIAQQLRTDDVFQEWLSALMRHFAVIRIDDDHLSTALRTNSGYVIHMAVLTEQSDVSA